MSCKSWIWRSLKGDFALDFASQRLPLTWGHVPWWLRNFLFEFFVIIYNCFFKKIFICLFNYNTETTLNMTISRFPVFFATDFWLFQPNFDLLWKINWIISQFHIISRLIKVHKPHKSNSVYCLCIYFSNYLQVK